MKKPTRKNYHKGFEIVLQTVLILPLLLLMITSCEREKLTHSNEQSNNLESNSTVDPLATTRSDYEEIDYEENFDYTKCTVLKNSIYKSEGMLVFQDEQHFEDCILCLEKDYEDYNDAYEAQYPDATVEQLDALDISNNFDPFTPYITFEQSLSFNSYRAKIEAEIVAFEEIPYDQVDMAEYPDILSPILDESKRALLNEDGMVKIGEETIDMTVPAAPNSLVFIDDCAFQLTNHYTATEIYNTELNNRQMILQISILSGFLTSTLKGKRTFRKKIGNRYRRRRARTTSHQLSGTGHTGECSNAYKYWNKSKGKKRRRKVTLKSVKWIRWLEALVCRDNPDFAVHGCAFSFTWETPSGGDLPFEIPLYRDWGCDN